MGKFSNTSGNDGKAAIWTLSEFSFDFITAMLSFLSRGSTSIW